MSSPETDRLVAEVEALLAEERRLLLDGQLEGLAPLQERKETLAARLAPLRPQLPPEQVARLHGQALRNQALLTAAAQGVRGIANRLAVIRQIAAGDGTYSPDGTRRRLGQLPRHERRA